MVKSILFYATLKLYYPTTPTTANIGQLSLG